MASICCFGDSLAKGVVFDTEKQRYTLIKNNFMNLFGAKEKVSVDNHSKFGCTITAALPRFERVQKAVENCDVIAFEFGGNDSNFNWNEISEDPDAEHKPNTELHTFISAYKTLLGKAIQTGKKVVMLNLPPLDYNKYFAWISKGNNADNILRWLGGTSDFIYRWHEQYNNAVHNIAREMKIPLVDIRSTFLGKRNYSDYLCVDGIHLNEKGHRLVAEALITEYEKNETV